MGEVCINWNLFLARVCQMAEGEEQKGTSAADRSTEEAEEFLPGFTDLEDYSKVLKCGNLCDFHDLVLLGLGDQLSDVNRVSSLAGFTEPRDASN